MTKGNQCIGKGIMNEQEFYNYAEIEEINEHLSRKSALVTVWCPAYNHGKYIRDTLNGFISQETDFAFQVLIYDDGSDDNTAKIIREFAYDYPNIIHAFLAERNTYQHPDRYMFTRKLKESNFVGKYVAICEGDDCWIDPHKLQIQVDYMETHPGCSLYVHNAIRINYLAGMEITTQNTYQCMDEKDVSSEEIIMLYRQHPATASMLYKRDLYFMPDLFEKLPFSDYAAQLFCMINGDVHYSSRIMSIYRFFAEESHTKKLADNKYLRYRFNMKLIIFLEQFDQYTSQEYHTWVTNQIQIKAFSLIEGLDDCLEEYIRKFYKEENSFAAGKEDILNRIVTLDKQVKEKNYIRKELEGFIRRFRNIVIMGTGNYSNKLSSQLEENHIRFCGYTVSKMDGVYEFRGKKVWQLNQINDIFDEVGVVVAIKPLKWNELVKSLENAGIQNYICPFKL